MHKKKLPGIVDFHNRNIGVKFNTSTWIYTEEITKQKWKKTTMTIAKNSRDSKQDVLSVITLHKRIQHAKFTAVVAFCFCLDLKSSNIGLALKCLNARPPPWLWILQWLLKSILNRDIWLLQFIFHNLFKKENYKRNISNQNDSIITSGLNFWNPKIHERESFKSYEWLIKNG